MPKKMATPGPQKGATPGWAARSGFAVRLRRNDDRCTGRCMSIPNLFDLISNITDLEWEPFRAGIKIHRIYGNQKDGPSAALLLYDPGTTLPRHTHQGYEHILVLSNS
jgi:anti-sigma factor ChrR (cupin superfamily)